MLDRLPAFPLFCTLVLFAALAWAGPALAAIALTSTAEVERTVVTDEGREELRLVPAEKVLPGETVRFTNRYVNTDEQAAERVVITNPVPEQMIYVEGSAFGEGTVTTVSVDAGETFAPLAELTVVGPEGGERPATGTDVTHLRWRLEAPVPPGGGGTVGYRARLK